MGYYTDYKLTIDGIDLDKEMSKLKKKCKECGIKADKPIPLWMDSLHKISEYGFEHYYRYLL